ncbi:MAG: hypothetical protein IJG82_09435 [Atopobiaceae bacterium]|nr:hypothetical protein [Atopobiaceae bacterium]
MTETESLRQLLDKRGVEWEARDGKTIRNTYWDDLGGRRWGYASDESESFKDRQLFLIRGRMDMSPEQAVEATLGRGTCRMELIYDSIYKCSECLGYVDVEDNDGEPNIWDCEDRAVFPNFCPVCGRKVVE